METAVDVETLVWALGVSDRRWQDKLTGRLRRAIRTTVFASHRWSPRCLVRRTHHFL